MGILNAARTKHTRTYQDAILRDELRKINDACDRFFIRRGLTYRRPATQPRANVNSSV